MRKITAESISAFFNGNTLHKANMRVEHGNMYLHGHLIAYTDLNKVFISNAGWESNTTKERLNAIVNHLLPAGNAIYQKDFEWFWKNGESFPCDMFIEVK